MKNKNWDSKKKKSWNQTKYITIAGCLLMLALFVGGMLETSMERKQRSVAFVVTIEAEPVIELRFNEAGQVMSWQAENDKARKLLSDSELKNCVCDAAADEIGQLLQSSGTVTSEQNVLLVTMEALHSGEKCSWWKHFLEQLQKEIQNEEIHAIVLGYTLPDDEELQGFEERYDLSAGKSALISCIMRQSDAFSEEVLCNCSITELLWIAASQKLDLEGFTQVGDMDFEWGIQPEQARTIAAEALNLSNDIIERSSVQLGGLDGKLVYQVRFWYQDVEDEVLIAVNGGQVVSMNRKQQNSKGQHTK